VTVSSFASENFTLEASLNDRKLHLDAPVTVQASSNAPVFYIFHFDDAMEGVIFDIKSDGDNEQLQAVVSLQNSSCPIYDLPSDVSFSGLHQTMRKQSYMSTTRHRLGRDIYLVLVVRPDEHCRIPEFKTFTIHARSAPPKSSYTWPLVFNFGIFLALPFLAYWLFISIEWFRGFGFNERMPPQTWLLDASVVGAAGAAQPSEPLQPLQRGITSYGAVGSSSAASTRPRAEVRDVAAERAVNAANLADDEHAYDEDPEANDAFDSGPLSRLDTRASVTSEAEPTPGIQLSHGRLDPSSKATRQWNTGINYTEDDVRVLRGQQKLRVNHLTRKLPKSQEKKFGQYAYYLMTLVVFYALPVSQLVYSQLSHFNQGNEDLCYYNFRCGTEEGGGGD
jgi:hypothetical protein